MNESILAKIGLDTGPFAQGLRQAKGLAKNFRAGLTSVLGKLGIGIGLGAFVSAFQSLLDKADSLQTTADRLKTSTDFFQRWVNGAASAGVATETSEAALKTYTKTLGDARRGNKEAARNFESLGVAIDNSLSPEELINPIADALASIRDPAERAAAAARLFGDEGADMLAALKDGAAGFERLRASAHGIISQEDLDHLNDTAKLWKQIKQDASAYFAHKAGQVAGFGSEIGLDQVALQNAFDKYGAKGIFHIAEERRALLAAEKEQEALESKREAKIKKQDDEKAAYWADAKKEADEFYAAQDKAYAEELKAQKQITAEREKQLAAAFNVWKTILKSEGELTAARADRGHFTVAELADLVPNSAAEASKIFAARDVMDAEAYARSALLNDRSDLANQAFAYSDRIRGSLGVLTAGERNPFGKIEASIAENTEELKRLTSTVVGNAVRILPTNGP